MQLGLISHPSDTERLLFALRAHTGEYVGDLYKRCSCMVHSRIADLRRDGHVIECKKFGHGDYRYRLIEGSAIIGPCATDDLARACREARGV